MLRNVGRAVIVKGGKDSSLDCALFNTYRRSKEPSERYEKDVNEMRSLCYYRKERGLYHINPKWLPPLQ